MIDSDAMKACVLGVPQSAAGDRKRILEMVPEIAIASTFDGNVEIARDDGGKFRIIDHINDLSGKDASHLGQLFDRNRPLIEVQVLQFFQGGTKRGQVQ